MLSHWETMSEGELAALTPAQLAAARTAVVAAVLDIETQLATDGRDARAVPYSADGPPPERVWRRAALRALKYKRSFLLRLKTHSRAAKPPAGVSKPCDRRRAIDVLADLADALSRYEFVDPEDAGLVRLLAEARAMVELNRSYRACRPAATVVEVV